MKNTVASAIAAAVLVSLAGAASAQALKPEEMIKIRKSGSDNAENYICRNRSQH